MGVEAEGPTGGPWTLTDSKYIDEMSRWSESEVEYELWKSLWPVFNGRPGWHFFLPNWEDRHSQDPIWAFPGSGLRIVVSVQESHYFLAYISETDTEYPFTSIEELTAWLEKTEPDYEGFTSLQEELFDYLLPKQVEKWKQGEEED